MLLFIYMPCVSVADLGDFATTSGKQLVGWIAWITFFAFALAAITRFIPDMIAYKNLLDVSAFAMVLVTILYAAIGSPIAQLLKDNQRYLANNSHPQSFNPCLRNDYACSAGRAPTATEDFSLTYLAPLRPEVGSVFFVLAPFLLIVARRRERT
jgi:hypothetical protein